MCVCGGGGGRFLNFKVPIGSPQDELVTEVGCREGYKIKKDLFKETMPTPSLSSKTGSRYTWYSQLCYNSIRVISQATSLCNWLGL